MSATIISFPPRETVAADSLDSIMRSVGAARYRLEDEGRPEFDWAERLEASALLAEALWELKQLRREAGD